MTTRTDTDLAKRVCQIVGEIGAVDVPPAEDDAHVKEISESVHQMLRKWNVCYWPEDEIPLEVYEPLARYVAGWAQGDYGEPIAEDELEKRLTKLKAAAALPYLGEQTKATYY